MFETIVRGYILVLVITQVSEIQCRAGQTCVVVAPRSIRSNSDYSMSIATHGATESMQFRVKIYEREEPRTNKTLDFWPNKKQTRQDPSDLVAKKGPKLKMMKKSYDDQCSRDDKASLTGSKTKTITVQPNMPQLIKFKVSYKTVNQIPNFLTLCLP
jgi:hypothetical protein